MSELQGNLPSECDDYMFLRKKWKCPTGKKRTRKASGYGATPVSRFASSLRVSAFEKYHP